MEAAGKGRNNDFFTRGEGVGEPDDPEAAYRAIGRDAAGRGGASRVSPVAGTTSGLCGAAEEPGSFSYLPLEPHFALERGGQRAHAGAGADHAACILPLCAALAFAAARPQRDEQIR